MNAPYPLHEMTAQPRNFERPDEDQINLPEYWDIIVDNKWLVCAITVITVAIGVAYCFVTRPVYESNLLIQVEDSTTSAKSLLGDAGSLFDIKTPAAAEMEIIRSRMIVGHAVDNVGLFIDARPRYLPVVGEWLGRRAQEPSNPSAFGWVTGSEAINVQAFDVPADLEDHAFILTLVDSTSFRIERFGSEIKLTGRVGELFEARTNEGLFRVLVRSIDAKPGAAFVIKRSSRLKTIEAIQDDLKLVELGKQSGIISATLQSTEPGKLSAFLNEVARLYVTQNVERKAAEAEKTLAFLDSQMPQFKRQLEQSEEAYNRYRNKKGTVSMEEESKLYLAQSVDLNAKLLDAKQRRTELIARFTPDHPAVKTLDAQIRSWTSEIAALDARVKGLPLVQQDAIRLQRDVKVNNELYEQIRNSALQMQLIREGKIGNVRIIDSATVPEDPVKPKKWLAVILSLFLGLVTGVGTALARSALARGIRHADEIEAGSDLSVYASIPLSEHQEMLARGIAAREPGSHLLFSIAPQDMAVESLRSLRTALQFAMIEAQNNLLVITGPSPGVGKSFVAANFAAVLASTGSRVLLIDADLRKGHLNRYFGVDRRQGLSELIVGNLSLGDAVHSGVVPNLDFVSSGEYPPNPAELVASKAFSALLEAASRNYDYVLLDTAPILAAPDTASIARSTGTTLMVARCEVTQLAELNEARRRLSHAGVSISGAILNALDLSKRHHGSYGYRYGGYKYQDYKYVAQ